MIENVWASPLQVQEEFQLERSQSTKFCPKSEIQNETVFPKKNTKLRGKKSNITLRALVVDGDAPSHLHQGKTC